LHCLIQRTKARKTPAFRKSVQEGAGKTLKKEEDQKRYCSEARQAGCLKMAGVAVSAGNCTELGIEMTTGPDNLDKSRYGRARRSQVRLGSR
jgi:hypothetical protein